MLHYNQDKTMKSKKLLIALAGCAAFVATACHGDLDIIQDNQLTASNMWTESSDVTTSAYGIYYLMRANFVQDKVNVFYWGEARVGEYMWGAGSWRTGHDNDMYGVQNSTMNDSNASTVWTKLYTAVNAANAVLKYAPTVPMTDADRQWAIGQAAFARAYLYFWAVRLWGDVPLLLNPVESVDAEECYPARSPKAYVYEQIGRDIETAVAYVTSGTDQVRRHARCGEHAQSRIRAVDVRHAGGRRRLPRTGRRGVEGDRHLVGAPSRRLRLDLRGG